MLIYAETYCLETVNQKSTIEI